MIAVIIAILIGISALLSAFVAFAPGIQQAIEQDFIRRADANTFLYSIQRGQLARRAGTIDNDPLTPIPANITLISPLRAKDAVSQNTVRSEVSITTNNTLTTNITFE